MRNRMALYLFPRFGGRCSSLARDVLRCSAPYASLARQNPLLLAQLAVALAHPFGLGWSVHLPDRQWRPQQAVHRSHVDRCKPDSRSTRRQNGQVTRRWPETAPLL